MKKTSFASKLVSAVLSLTIAVSSVPAVSLTAYAASSVSSKASAALKGPAAINAQDIGTDSFRVSWERVDGADAYLLLYRKKGTETWSADRQNGVLDYCTDTRTWVEGLKKGTTYEIIVYSCKKSDGKYVTQGKSGIYTLKTKTSDKCYRAAQPNMVVKCRSNRLDITWDKWYHRPWAVDSFAVLERYNSKTKKWEPEKDSSGNVILFRDGTATLTNLKPGKSYTFRLWSYDDTSYSGMGKACDVSDAFTVKTPKISGNVWDGSVDTSWYKSGKTSYNISTAAQLAGLAKLTNDGKHPEQFRGVTFNLTKDIKLNDTSDFSKWYDYAPMNVWTPIGSHGGGAIGGYKPFAGTFNGNGHTISGMYATTAGYCGLFGYVSGGAILSLNLEKCMSRRFDSSQDGIGSLIGECEGTYIARCKAEKCFTYTWNYPTGGGVPVGGLVGYAGKVDNSDLMVISALSIGMFGFIVNPLFFAGENTGFYKTGGTCITDCIVSDCEITTDGGHNTGALLGYAGTDWKKSSGGAFIYNCLGVNNKINTSGEYGALCGGGYGEMKNCYSYNLSTKNTKGDRYDIKVCKEITKKKLYSSSFVKTLGSAFSYKKNSLPVIRQTEK